MSPFFRLLSCSLLLGAAPGTAAPQPSNFDTFGEESLSLNGTWKFRTASESKFPGEGDIVVDNADASTKIEGTWKASQWQSGGPFWGTNYLVSTARAAGVPARVIFTPTVPAAGTYEVFTTWSRGSRDGAVHYTVNFSGGSREIKVDQSASGPRWFSLGKFPFAAGTGNSLVIDASGPGLQVVADAFLLHPVKDGAESEAAFAPSITETDWVAMTVPGNWDTKNTYAHFSGAAWYRREFAVPADWKGSHLRLHFDAVNQEATVYLNGKPLGSHSGGYTPFEFDVTNLVQFGRQNLLAVRADNSYHRGAWWPWGGISRPVELVRNRDVRITGQRIFAEPNLETHEATVTLTLAFRNEGMMAQTATASTEVTDPAGSSVYREDRTVSVEGNSEQTVEWTITLPASKVRLWDIDHPNLYNCRTILRSQAGVLHARVDRFGIRKIAVTKDALLLNGEPVRLGGFNRVYDHRAWGNTEPEHLIRQDVDMMKRLGCNLTRIMHGAQSPALLDYLDEKGVLVFEECPVWGSDDPVQREPGDAKAKRWLREMIERDVNHPCIIGWSVGNELRDHYNYVKAMTDYVRHDLDPHRLTGYVSNSGSGTGSTPANDPITFSDLAMHNDYGSNAQLARTIRSKWPDKPVFNTEFGARQIGSSLDAQIPGLEKHLDEVRRDCPYLVGVSMWTFNDYRSPFKDSSLTEDRTWGMVDVWRRPKRAFEQIAAQFSPIRSLSLENLADGQDRATIQLVPRTAGDFPCHILRDYKLKWELRGQDDRTLQGGLFDLPVIKPGDTALTFPIAWKSPALPVVDVLLSLMSPTGYVAHESAVPLAVPSAPRITAVVAGKAAVRVIFEPVAGATEYKVVYSAQGGAAQESAATIDTQVTLDKLESGKQYRFAVVASNGKGAGQPSEAVTITPGEVALPPEITAMVPTDGGFCVGFSAEKEDRTYSLQYGTDAKKLTETLSSLTVKGSAVVEGLKNGTTYYVRLQREGEFGVSGWSNIVAVTPNGQLPPPVPRLFGGVRGKGSLCVRFAPSEQAVAYKVRYKAEGATNWSVADVDAAAVTEGVFSGIDDSKSYSVQIAALGAGGLSEYSRPQRVEAAR